MRIYMLFGHPAPAKEGGIAYSPRFARARKAPNRGTSPWSACIIGRAQRGGGGIVG
jgi:hypothetical protein